MRRTSARQRLDLEGSPRVLGSRSPCTGGAFGSASTLRRLRCRRRRHGVDGQSRCDTRDRRRAARDVRGRPGAVSVRAAGAVVARAQERWAGASDRWRTRGGGRHLSRDSRVCTSIRRRGRGARRGRDHDPDAVHHHRRLRNPRCLACARHRRAARRCLSRALRVTALGHGSRDDSSAAHRRGSRGRQRAAPRSTDRAARPRLDHHRRSDVERGRTRPRFETFEYRRISTKTQPAVRLDAVIVAVGRARHLTLLTGAQPQRIGSRRRAAIASRRSFPHAGGPSPPRPRVRPSKACSARSRNQGVLAQAHARLAPGGASAPGIGELARAQRRIVAGGLPGCLGAFWQRSRSRGDVAAAAGVEPWRARHRD